jgi:hypothetical protein
MAFLRSENGVLYTVSCAEAATRSLKEASLIPSSSALRVTVLVDSLRFHWGLRAIHVQMWMFYAHVLTDGVDDLWRNGHFCVQEPLRGHWHDSVKTNRMSWRCRRVLRSKGSSRLLDAQPVVSRGSVVK